MNYTVEGQKFTSYMEIQRIHNGQNRCLWRRKMRFWDMTVSLESQKQNGKSRKKEKSLPQNRKHWNSRVQKRLMRHFFCMEKAEGLPFIRWIVEMSIPISLWEWNLQRTWAIPLMERITGWFMQHRGCQQSR